jgi:undecaprenyl-diphosphatase
MPPAEPPRSFRRALALGLIQGPTELLPISSSAHTRLIPWLVGWDESPPGHDDGRTFELALHGAACLALAVEMAGPLRREIGPPSARVAVTALLAVGTPALAGLTLGGTLQRHLSGARATAAGLIAGAAGMVLADRLGADDRSTARDAAPFDGLLLGLAQALALAPGVSRNGATLTAARARGFTRPAAQRLSWGVGLPVMGGASAAEALRAARGGPPREATALLTGALGAFLSTRLSARLMVRHLEHAPLWPYALYRLLLAGLIVRSCRRAQWVS